MSAQGFVLYSYFCFMVSRFSGRRGVVGGHGMTLTGQEIYVTFVI
jgi:hypothetical protein